MALFNCWNLERATILDPWLSNELPWENLVLPCNSSSQCTPNGLAVSDRLRYRCGGVEAPVWLPELREEYDVSIGNVTEFNVSQYLFSRHPECSINQTTSYLKGVCNCGSNGYVGRTCAQLDSLGSMKLTIVCIAVVLQLILLLKTIWKFASVMHRTKSIVVRSIKGQPKAGKHESKQRELVTGTNQTTSTTRNASASRTRIIFLTTVCLSLSSLAASLITVYELTAPMHADEHIQLRMVFSVATMVPIAVCFVEVNLLMSMHVLHVVAIVPRAEETKKVVQSNKLRKHLRDLNSIRMFVKVMSYSLLPAVGLAVVVSPTLGQSIFNSITVFLFYFGFVIFTIIAGPCMLQSHARRFQRLLNSEQQRISSSSMKKPSVADRVASLMAKRRKDQETEFIKVIDSINLLCFKNMVCVIGVSLFLGLAITPGFSFIVFTEFAKLCGVCTGHIICAHLYNASIRKSRGTKVAAVSDMSSYGTLTS